MRRWGVRTRLTVAVTAIFATASIVAGVVALRITEDRLLADTRANAEQMLSDYVARLYGGTAAAPTVDADESTSFFFLDAAGSELSERQYVTTLLADTLASRTRRRIGAGLAARHPPRSRSLGLAVPSVPGDVVAGGVGVDAAGQFVANNGEVVRFALAPAPTGAPAVVDRGAGVVAVAQTFACRTAIGCRCGVSSPLELVTDSVGAMRWLLWIGIPLVTAMVAVITWLTTTRALRPVHAITVRAREITASNLAEPVPVPASQDEIHELATTVNQMLARLDANHRQQRQFVADASHELRSPGRRQHRATRGRARPTGRGRLGGDGRRGVDRTAAARASGRRPARVEPARRGRRRSRSTESTWTTCSSPRRRGRGRPRSTWSAAKRSVCTGSPALMTRLVRNLLDNAAHHASGACRGVAVDVAGVGNGAG